MKDKKALWDRAVDFHGHACPGLTIGYRAALYAAELQHREGEPAVPHDR